MEQIAFGFGVVFALVIVATGAYLASREHEPHWMNRAGAAVVALQALVAAVEFNRRQRLQTIERHAAGAVSSRGAGYLEKEIARAEGQALRIVLALAFLGELLHGFGDLAYEAVARIMITGG